MLLASFQINYKKAIELVLTRNNINNTKNTVTQRKSKNPVFLLKMSTLAKILWREYKFFKRILNLYKVRSTCAKFQLFGIVPSVNKIWCNFTNTRSKHQGGSKFLMAVLYSKLKFLIKPIFIEFQWLIFVFSQKNHLRKSFYLMSIFGFYKYQFAFFLNWFKVLGKQLVQILSD